VQHVVVVGPFDPTDNIAATRNGAARAP